MVEEFLLLSSSVVSTIKDHISWALTLTVATQKNHMLRSGPAA